MTRTRERVLCSIDRLYADLISSGMRRYAARLRRYTSELDRFGKSEKQGRRKIQRRGLNAVERGILRQIMY